jgi:hypothetical protein
MTIFAEARSLLAAAVPGELRALHLEVLDGYAVNQPREAAGNRSPGL